MRPIIACSKISLFLLVCLITIPLQALGLMLFGNHKLFYVIPHMFHNSTCAIFGIRIKIKGTVLEDTNVVYVGNHLSYIDICSIGGNLPATFISKMEVKGWPIFGILACLSKTVFIDRRPEALNEAIISIEKSLKQGRSLILFPEATSTDGHTVIPFKSGLFELFLNENLKEKVVVQPFTLTIDPPQDHDLYAWYGDMTMLPHLWKLAKSKGVDLTLILHPPRKATNYDNRKQFAQDCYQDVLKGLDLQAKPA
jgi:1-acyl-sn-glycerol-3-phosphate acyltransferase